ncbi:sugar phosphate isomerase/epimerase [Streptomyces kunmingensis]|uniref:Sugar phosphate isomerase/epimerase n=1 Tax=Streptomyces kunmingensis TaxID=68225 RepID=A0ABU6C2J9_9ACTN|nr:sugar phosphate isomerase/epimerase family protein [Streptomyces kunmingensis]MEB3958934.1 sugar phosphate isomerase/epimerase [Streptomyces kunmingensis]
MTRPLDTLPWPLAYTVSSDDCRTPMPLGFDAPLAEAARHLAELGYDGVEIQVRDVGAADAERLRAAVAPTGLRITALGTGPVTAQDGLSLTDPAPDVRRHALDRLLGAVRLAAALGVPVTLGQSRGTFLPGLAEPQRHWAEQAVRQLAAEADALGTRLLIEPQTRTNTSLWHTPDETLAFTATLDAPTGLALDTHHLESEGLDPVTAVTEYLPATGCVQLASDTGRGPLTVGDLRLPPLLRALREGGFTGWLTCEHVQEGDSARAAARSWTALRDAATTGLS